MSNDFHLFAQAVEERFRVLSTEHNELYVVNASDTFSLYLASFPEGFNPIFRERTEHDCACCKSFVRHLGNVVALSEAGQILTVWDHHDELPEPYATVAQEMGNYIRSLPIRGLFRTMERGFGAKSNVELLEDGTTRTWSHFWGKVPSRFVTASPAEAIGKAITNVGVFRRGVEEITASALATVADLIEENALYRGAEFKSSVAGFKAMYDAYPRDGAKSAKDAFLWQNVANGCSLLRNTAIGTLLVDLSDGVDTEKAVRSFESKVAPLNYKRPTAVITPKMIEDGIGKLRDMGLESAIERRFANIHDVSVNNVLWVDNTVRGLMKGGLEGLLLSSVKPAEVNVKNATPIGIEEFLKDVLPQARSVELSLRNRHLTNFMSLTAPVHQDAGGLFKWDNNFAWSYDGDATDSIKSRVKRAGGKVDTKMRVSLAWANHDDLDLHCLDPRGRQIYFGNKEGILDVDMNNGFSGPLVRDPVENLAWDKVADGDYMITIHNYTRRESIDVGFSLELEFDGVVQQFTHERAVNGNQRVPALTITVRDGALAKVSAGSGLIGGSQPTTKWGVTTETLVPVTTILASPNHWDGQQIGNKHWFFILKDALNPEPVRGIYNEFLKPELEPHRKVFEMLGAKTKAPFVPDQLSGVGFSSTRSDLVTAIVKGERINRAYAITF